MQTHESCGALGVCEQPNESNLASCSGPLQPWPHHLKARFFSLPKRETPSGSMSIVTYPRANLRICHILLRDSCRVFTVTIFGQTFNLLSTLDSFVQIISGWNRQLEFKSRTLQVGGICSLQLQLQNVHIAGVFSSSFYQRHSSPSARAHNGALIFQQSSCIYTWHFATRCLKCQHKKLWLPSHGSPLQN